MSNIRNILKKLLPEHTARGRLVRHISSSILSAEWVKKRYNAIRIHKFDKHAAALLEPDVLNEKIAYIRAMAEADSADKEYYIINWSYSKATSVGLCAGISVHFCSVAYALAIGKIPVIDMQSHPNLYLEEDKLGKENAWEYYLEQPFGCGLDCITNKNAAMSGGPIFNSNCLPRTLTGSEPDFDVCFQAWRTIYRHCFRLNKTSKEYIDEEYNSLFKPGMRVLGVNCRGADYNPVMAKNHPIQPDMDTLIAKVKTSMAQWECDHIFLAAPEKKSFDIFDSHFPGRVLRNKAAYYDEKNADFTKQYLGSVRHERPNDAYLNGLEYLSAVVLLSRCTSAVFGQTAGSTVARYINDGKYENVFVFDLGKY